ncbi:MAG TPA: ABC transporter permease [Pyrinomonadaceae bacterium]|nr:ABC transporter permease [Pyrinomonadaceae bacterium]
MNNLWQDVRYGVRVLLRSPGFTAVAILVTALAIGANTAIFSVINAVLLRPLPYSNPERMVMVWGTQAKRGVTRAPFSYLDFADYHEQSNSFDGLAAYTDASASLAGRDAPEQITGEVTSADFFKALGVQPALGRAFVLDDERSGVAGVVIISHATWQHRFGGDQNIIGRQVTLDGKSRTVVGVLPADFQFPFSTEPPEYFLPLNPNDDLDKARGAHYLTVVGRLKPGVTPQQASAEMKGIAARLEQQYPDDDASRGINIVGAQDDMVGTLRPTLLILLGAVGFVLLIACANVANLLLARSSRRVREIALRVALGASRGRIVRQLLTESLVLSFAGGVLGLLVAFWGINLISSFVPADIPRFSESRLDPTVLAFTLGASVLTGLVFGLAPALSASKLDLNEALKEGGRSTSEGRARNRVRSLLIISEVALSLVLLVGAGLLVKSFVKLRNTNPGFNPENVLTASISLPLAQYSEDAKITQFYQQTIDRVSQLPGVESVGAITPLPLSDNGMSITFYLKDGPPPLPGESPVSAARVTSPDYFRTMGVPVVEGRAFSDADRADTQKVVIINQTLARKFFPGTDPLGRQLHLGLNDLDSVIVGVVGDVRHQTLDKEPGPEFYVPFTQVAFGDMSLVVRTRTDDPATLSAPLRGAVQSVDKDIPLFKLQTMQSLVGHSVARQRFSMTLIAGFAGLALALAMAGIFSVMSFLVAQRTHEIGIRMALGAQQRDILRMVVFHAMGRALVGVAGGLLAAFALTREMASLLYQVSATDPFVFGGIAVLLALVALVACLVPARRATKVDPMIALRYE